VIFIGSGSLLRHALLIAEQSSIKIDLVCAERDNGLVQFCHRSNFSVISTNNVNDDLLVGLKKSSDGIAIMVNSSSIIRDELLTTSVAFFNIHNGLVQKYRGLADVCVFASICKIENEYGSTLQRLLPRHQVDAGPTLDQRSFKVEMDDDFETVFSNSIDNYKNQLESTLPKLSSFVESGGKYLHGTETYSYRHVTALIGNAPEDRRSLACSLGRYSGLLPRLSSLTGNSRKQSQ